MAGVKGEVMFTQTQGRNSITTTWNITGTGSYTWQIHQLYVNYDNNDKCSLTSIGERYGTVGGIINSGTHQLELSGIAISGLNTIEGRTLKLIMVEDNTIKSCATIVPMAHSTTAMARFDNQVYGEVYFRKSPESDSTVIYTDLFIGGGYAPTNYTWNIYTGIKKDCSGGTSVFNPTGITGMGCSLSNHGNCVIGKLSLKLGDLNLGSARGSALRRYVDLNLPLHGDNSIIDTYLVLLNEVDELKQCAHIGVIARKHARGTFNAQGVKGHISFMQYSKFDYTSIEVWLKGLNSIADGYHVHTFPVPQRSTKDQFTCSASYVGGHLNPFGIIKVDGPADGIGTNDQYEVGDISGKFGGLAGKDEVYMNMTDWNIPLFGSNSIIHRSLVIHKTSGGLRWICANINDMYPVKASIARFTYPFIGHAIIRQRLDVWTSEASIFIELNSADGTTNSSMYDWQINTYKVGDDSKSEKTERCKSTGSIYHPFHSNGSAKQFAVKCDGGYHSMCLRGDLTGKHGQVKVRDFDNTAAEHFFTDLFLSLSGDDSIIGRSLVLLKDSQIIGCATIYEIQERYAMVESWSKGVTGQLRFSQSFGLIHEKTKIISKLQNLGNVAGPYHVHTLAVPAGVEVDCFESTTWGIFNPYNVDASTDLTPKMGSHDQYGAGDLSGKFGYLSGDYYNTSHFDMNLDLFGVHSVVGRSMVLFRASDSTPWSCGNVVEDTTMTGGTRYQAKAVFDTHVTGYVLLSQYMYPDGSMSDTSVEVDLRYADGSDQTLDHNWHVHENRVDGDDQAPIGRCASTGGHYNPFNVNLQSLYEECSETNPLRCELGDQSNKLGPYSIGLGRKFSTDVYLPLNGPYSVIGRAIVFHVEDKGAGRFACATLMPVDGPLPLKMSIVTPTTLDRDAIAMAIAKSISAKIWQVMVVDTTAESPGCTDLQIYFMGPGAEAFREASMMTQHEKTLFSDSFPRCSKSGASKLLSTFIVVAMMNVCKLII